MSGTKEKLQVLLDYWIEHNQEHEEEFRDWAQKVASLSTEVAQQLQEAATKMAAASNDLIKARQALTKSEEGH
ncbi:MAG: hypothetical protein SU899_05510 [Chloroflexota bacterium]|nr:hypothetical protein [Chloroflexota bacterium]